MKVIITGNMGYVGPVVVQHLRKTWPEAELVGYDSGLFASSLLGAERLPESLLDRQIFGDIRDLDISLLAGADAVIHLAAVSNDPMGKEFETPTDEINTKASIRVAELAKAAGVKSFVFASSCSVYGFAEGAARREGDQLDPLTAYARSKIAMEEALATLASDEMTVSCLRFATACGLSPRLRLDLVLNDFVATALRQGVINVLSDGTPWRPLINVRDMARAIEWAVKRPVEVGGNYLVVNAGSDVWNYRVSELADRVAEAVGNVGVSINKDAPPDRRSYRVDFATFRHLAPDHQPVVSLDESIAQLVAGLRAASCGNMSGIQLDGIRLATLKRFIGARILSPNLRWLNGEAATATPICREA